MSYYREYNIRIIHFPRSQGMSSRGRFLNIIGQDPNGFHDQPVTSSGRSL